MTDIETWAFVPDELDLDGDMTLVLARRQGTKLVGGKIEFANEATPELRQVIHRSVDHIAQLERRAYEPSLTIEQGEYMAVPDALVAKAAAPVESENDSNGSTIAPSSSTPRSGSDTRIETDPQVRAFLRQASGLDLLTPDDIQDQKRWLFYAIVVGSDPDARTSFVRKINPIKAMEANKVWFAWLLEHGSRLTQVSNPLLALEEKVDLVVTNDGIAVINQYAFEQLFQDSDTLVSRIPTWADSFSVLGLTEDQKDVLVLRCRKNSRLAKRLRQIHESGHLSAGHVTLDMVLSEADRVAGGREQFLTDGHLDFSGPEVNRLLQLLNEDLFIGGLSQQPYQAGSKAARAV